MQKEQRGEGKGGGEGRKITAGGREKRKKGKREGK